jgi:hypothetical protein
MTECQCIDWFGACILMLLVFGAGMLIGAGIMQDRCTRRARVEHDDYVKRAAAVTARGKRW